MARAKALIANDPLRRWTVPDALDLYNIPRWGCGYFGIAPNGHLVVCEDQYTENVLNHLRGITPEGVAYPLALSRIDTEWAGACFSPDGKTLFANLYQPTRTLAITGPWMA